MVWFHFGLVWDGMVPTGSEGRWEKFKPAQRPKMTTHLWAGHVFPAFDFWHLSTAHVLVVFAHFFIFMKLSETKWMRAYRQTTRWSRELQNPACKLSILRTKMVLGHLGKIDKWTWKECKISKSCIWSYPNFATVQNLKLETVGLSDCIASYQESEDI